MSLGSRRLAWTLVLEPRRPEVDPPPWPALVLDTVGKVEVPEVDPVARILKGPFPLGTMARRRSEADLPMILSGVGRRVALTIVDNHLDPYEGRFVLEPLRARIASTVLGLEPPDVDAPASELAATPTRLGALLAERFEDDPDWDFVGLCEVSAALMEGVPADLPTTDGYMDHGDLRIERAVGVGQGHLAFVLSGYWTNPTEMGTMERRLHVLTHGHQSTVPPLAHFAAHALDWGRSARTGMNLDVALDGVIADVRVAASWAVSGGPLPGDQEPDFDRLAARLEMLRVRTREVIRRLRAHRADLEMAARRIVGEGAELLASSPFPEASARADELADALATREEAAASWAEALEVARRTRD